MPAEMTTGRRIQFIGESKAARYQSVPCPALPCPAPPRPTPPRPTLPCPALPPTVFISVHVKSSPCNLNCQQLCANTSAISILLHVSTCSKCITRMCVCSLASRVLAGSLRKSSVIPSLCICSKAFSKLTAEQMYVTSIIHYYTQYGCFIYILIHIMAGIHVHLMQSCTIPLDARTSTSKAGFQEHHS